ncbi:SGNH/GDSL hydrolase family protein [Magnetospirillum molischianum]|uniref:SGNH/GDSL hydrolase family protein n=1 Tax=Magnetospirillum molischianum TaxID=1083 RepID=UPI00138AFCAB|nr:SGNH/GDSL hydrolase family protein [Magnetospirillum molischianum]
MRVDYRHALPHVAAKLAGGGPVRVVTLGSSSTAGFGASSADHSYPTRLGELLAQAFRNDQIEVINSGINGQNAEEMVARLYHDAIEEGADLVIWQTGTNDAVSRIDPEKFRDHLERGIAWLAEAGIDLILMDPQFYPGLRSQPVYERYVEVMRETAARHDVPLFPRYELMRHWASLSPPPAFLSDDRFHLNDDGYACIAELVAAMIIHAVRDGPQT